MGTWQLQKRLAYFATTTVLCVVALACTPGSQTADHPTTHLPHPTGGLTKLTNWTIPLGDPGDPTWSGPDSTDPNTSDESSSQPGPGENTPADLPADSGDPGERPDTSPTSYIASQPRMGIGGCPIYPDNNVFHADVRGLEARADSDLILAALGDEFVSGPLSKVRDGVRKGLPVNVVDSTVERSVKVVKQGFLLQPESLGYFPLPKSPRIQGYPGISSDQHLLLFDTATCRTHEFFIFRPPYLSWYQTWEASSAYTLDMTSNQMPKRAATVSAISMIAGMIRYDEVEAGSINHVLVAAVPNTSTELGVWPAAPRTDGKNTDPNAPRIGTWLRLKDIDMTKFGPKAQVIVRAMQKHGVVIHDTNLGRIGLGKENDSRWDDADMGTLRQIRASDFEVIDPTPMMVSRDSYEIR